LIPDDRSHCTAHSAPFVPATFTTSGNTVEPRLVTPKKSQAKARMIPQNAYCAVHKLHNTRSSPIYRDKENVCVDRSCERLARVVITELPTPTDSHTGDEGRKLEEIRKLANRVHDAGPVMGPAFGMALDILDILNSTPTAKGGRK